MEIIWKMANGSINYYHASYHIALVKTINPLGYPYGICVRDRRDPEEQKKHKTQHETPFTYGIQVAKAWMGILRREGWLLRPITHRVSVVIGYLQF